MLTASLNVADSYTHQLLNQSIDQGVIAFASVRAIHAVIALLEGTEISVPFLTVSIGEVLSPATEILQSTSTVLTTALASLGLQKILLEMFSTKVFNAIVLISGIGFLCTLWLKLSPALSKFIRSAFGIICLSRFIIVLALLLNGVVDSLFLNQQADQLTQQTDFIKQDIQQINQKLIETPPPEDDGLWGQASRAWNSLSSGFEQTKKQWEQDFDRLQDKIEDLIENLLTLIALFTLKTILIPIGFLLLLKKLMCAWSVSKGAVQSHRLAYHWLEKRYLGRSLPPRRLYQLRTYKSSSAVIHPTAWRSH